jgi:hypothetical protein
MQLQLDHGVKFRYKSYLKIEEYWIHECGLQEELEKKSKAHYRVGESGERAMERLGEVLMERKRVLGCLEMGVDWESTEFRFLKSPAEDPPTREES